MFQLNFDNAFLRELPGKSFDDRLPRQVSGACWSRVHPEPVSNPSLVAWSRELAAELGLSEKDVTSPAFVQSMAGNRLLEGMDPWASGYGGHQFGHWAGQLGDGRAISLGEVITPQGNRRELQLKGAGRTPYSRAADGRAVLRSSLREFVCSEAMYHLGIPTTRALSLVLTGDTVVRDMFYDGNPRPEPGAIVCRVAPSFIRPGNFELLAHRGETALLEQLVDFTIARDFPEIQGNTEAKRAEWFRQVCLRNARTVARWMGVGFVHGVMNTDNLSILGLTIDYGPYGWVDNLDPDWTPNTTDAQGRRYAFGRQPDVAMWNMQCLARALTSLFPDQQPLQDGLEAFAETFSETSRIIHRDKLGLERMDQADLELIQSLYELMETAEIDMTIFFRTLADMDIQQPDLALFAPAFYREDLVARHEQDLRQWLARYAARARQDAWPATLRRARMNRANPRYVPRNYLAQQAIDAAEAGDYSPLHELMEVLRNPWDDQPGREAYARRRPEWARHKAGSSMLSCSS